MLLEAKRLVKIYGGRKNGNSTRALNGMNLKVHKNEFVGVMGPSGSGKTTLLNILSGIDKATSGEVYINEKNINKLEKNKLAVFRRRNMGFVFQDFNLLDSLTVAENIMLPLILDKVDSNIVKERANEIMSFLDINDIKEKYPYNLSGGQQQRISAARALITNPSIVFADEPTGNLDSKSSDNIMRYLEEIYKNNKSTILMVTHDPFAASFCEKIVFIKDGAVNMEIVRKGTRKEFLNRILDCLAIVGGGIR